MCDLLQLKRTRHWLRYEILQALMGKTMVKVKQEPGEEVESSNHLFTFPISHLVIRMVVITF